MKYYKVLDKHGYSCHGGGAEWSLPKRNADGTWTPGEWMPPVEGDLKPCLNGYHLATLEQLVNWLGERIFEVEVGDEIVHADDKSVARTCRLIRECTGWNERTARLFACDCAERVLYLFEARHPDDGRPRKAIETSRRYAEGKADVEELAAAGDASWYAARAAEEAAARAAAEAASRAAAEDATEAAAGDASWYAARAAEEAAALNTSRAASRAALNAERNWQIERLGEILELAYRGSAGAGFYV